jgi:hypothetical protein
MLRLPEKWIRYLLTHPETGMGYYIVSVVLKDGRRFDQVIVDSGFITKVRGEEGIPFDVSEIDQIIVTHDKWEFRKT